MMGGIITWLSSVKVKWLDAMEFDSLLRFYHPCFELCWKITFWTPTEFGVTASLVVYKYLTPNGVVILNEPGNTSPVGTECL